MLADGTLWEYVKCNTEKSRKLNNVNSYMGISLHWMLSTIPTKIVRYDK
jgi:hypothetical protein